MTLLYPQYQKWNRNQYRGGDGILVGADLAQEWLLPWWWDHYRKNNSFPVAWIDLGMTAPMQEWCRERGELIPLRIIADLFVAPREEISQDRIDLWENAFGTSFWNSRNAWFKKPFVYLQTPYERTIWMDCDCEVKGSIQPLFDFSDPTGIGMRDVKSTIFPLHYSSGVLVYRWGHPAFELFAEGALTRNHEFFADDILFTDILIQGHFPVRELSDRYHRFRRENEEGSIVYHWIGSNGKKIIRSQIIKNQLGEWIHGTTLF